MVKKGRKGFQSCTKDFKDIGTELSPYAIETRYPEFEEPALEDANNAVKIAEKFSDFIVNRLSKVIEGER